MKAAAHTTFAERLGRAAGRAWRSSVRLDRRAQNWLLARGWAPGAAKAVLLVVKLAVIGVLLYTAFWLALLLAVLVAAAWSMRNSPNWTAVNEEQPEWREGHGGFGLYDKNEWRHDMGDPDR